MFGIRTPVKSAKSAEEPQAGPSSNEGRASLSSVRRSIGEWESGQPDKGQKLKSPPKKVLSAEPQKPKAKITSTQDSKAAPKRPQVEASGSPKLKYIDRLSEARACLTKAKLHLGNSRNLKTEIKTEVLLAIDRLYQLVKESESVKGKSKEQHTEKEKEPEKKKEPEKERVPEAEKVADIRLDDSELMKVMEEHTRLLKENGDKIEKLQETLERKTYASVAAAPTKIETLEQTALHSVVVTSKVEMETGEEILNRIRKAINAKEGDIAIEKVRKAKDRKVIIGCRTEEEREKFKDRLKGVEDLNVEEMRNKDPLVVLRSVLKYNTDEEVISALRKQNRGILEGIEDHKIEIRYKRQSRNPLSHDIIMRVSPAIWQRLVSSGTVQIDLQRVRVADQSPLVQCSQCLGYGHGRRFCTEALPKCSHCGGPHMKADCPDFVLGTAPSCCNCTQAKANETSHNAFSAECPIRRKWDALARATIAYC